MPDTHSLSFGIEKQSLLELVGIPIGQPQPIRLIDADFAGTKSVNTVPVDFNISYDINVGLELQINRPSLGEFGLQYPVTTTFDAPDSVAVGETYSVGTGNDFTSSGVVIEGESLNFAGAELNLVAEIGRVSLTDIKLFDTPFGALADLPDVPIISQRTTLNRPLWESTGLSAEQTFGPVTISAAAPTGVEKSSTPTGTSAPGTLDNPSLTLRETLVQAQLSLAKLGGVFFPQLRPLTGDVDADFRIGSKNYELELEYSILDFVVGAGYGIVQSYDFDPNDVTTAITVDGETVNGTLGDSFRFVAPDTEGTINGSIFYDFAGDLEVNYALGSIGSITPKVLQGRLKIEEEVAGQPDKELYGINVEPFGPIDPFTFDLKKPVNLFSNTISIGQNQFAEITRDFTIAVTEEPEDEPPGEGDDIGDIGGDFEDGQGASIPRLIDPLVLDLFGDGVSLTPREGSSVRFDMDGDSFAEHTSWISPRDGFLAVDGNGNGIVDGIGELFGDEDTSGFAALAVFDANSDGLITRDDPIFRELRIWRDINSDGKTDARELRPVAGYDIVSFDLNFNTVNFDAQGNQIHERSVFTRSDNTSGELIDVWFDVNPTNTESLDQRSIPAAVLALPNLRGYGEVGTLHEAMRDRPPLLNRVENLDQLSLSQIEQFDTRVEDILYYWARTENVAIDSRGPNFDGRKLATLEAFLGTQFNANGVTNPAAAATAFLENAWDTLFASVSAGLIAQTAFSQVLPDQRYSADNDTLTLISERASFIGADLDETFSRLTESIPEDARDAAIYFGWVLRMLNAFGPENGYNLQEAGFAERLDAALDPFGLSGFETELQNVRIAGTGMNAVQGALSESGVTVLSDAADSVRLAPGTQAVFGGSGNDNIRAASTFAVQMIDGGAGNDRLSGSSGDDTLDGGLGADVMIGGLGNDTYIVDNVGDLVVEASNAGTDTVESSISYTAPENIENVTLMDTGGGTARGNDLANILTGSAGIDTLIGERGRDTLDGGAGADVMIGGRDDDVYVVDNDGDIVIERPGEGIDTIRSTVNFTLDNTLENLILEGTGNIRATGSSANNTLTGNDGNNVLNGLAGRDIMRGGLGNDIYFVDSGSDSVTEGLDEGIDTVRSTISYTLGTNVENLILDGTGTLNGNGNALDNRLIGGTGDNTLSGGAGEDRMIGLDGDDRYFVDNIDDVVVEQADEGYDHVFSSVSHTLSNNVEELTLTGIIEIDATGSADDNRLNGSSVANNLIGLDGDDMLFGNAGNDTLVGGRGNDMLDGGTGMDRMNGGRGDDTYIVDSIDDVVAEAANGGTDTIFTPFAIDLNATLLLGVENVVMTGSALADITGNALDNALTGNAAANTIDGGAGIDVMLGGNGNDVYVVDNRSDIVDESGSSGNDLVISSVGFVMGEGVEHLQLTGQALINGIGNELDNDIIGNAGANLLVGGAGSDRLDGGGDADIMMGGIGNDVYTVDNVGDMAVEERLEGTDLVESSVSFALGDHVENLTLTGIANASAKGNRLSNILIGNDGRNVINGVFGSDNMAGGLGNDVYVVNSSGDWVTEDVDSGYDIVGASISYTLTANVEQLALRDEDDINGRGNALDNRLFGNIGNNDLNGLGGADLMIGLAGDDTYTVDNIGDEVREAAGEGFDIVFASASVVLTDASVERIEVSGSGDVDVSASAEGNTIIGNSGINTLRGNGGDDTIFGNGGDDRLLGGAGNDILDGGTGIDITSGAAGDDRHILDSATDIAVERVNEGHDTLVAGFDVTLAAHFEDLELTGSGSFAATGNIEDNRITGNNGSNVIDGMAGADIMIGLGGNDTYIIDNAGDVADETGGSGLDTIRASVNVIAGAGIENIELVGTDRLVAAGNELNNVLTGDAGNDVLVGMAGRDALDGGTGADRMVGGDDNDFYTVDNIGDTVIEEEGEGTDTVTSSVSFTAFRSIENIFLTGTANISAIGDEGNTFIEGNDGNNLLDGGAGIDNLIGGLGNDVYVVDHSSDRVTESAGEGTDTVRSSVAYTLGANVENLILFGDADVLANGNSLDNLIIGNNGDNSINGSTGADRMVGGEGNDFYTVDNTGDRVIENTDAGFDKVVSSVDFTLGNHVETLELERFSVAINAIGNAGDNILTGNRNNNVIAGGNGDDEMFGQEGDDRINAGSGDDLLDGGTGGDTLSGGTGNDVYIVDSLADRVLEGTGGGYDTVRSSVAFILGNDVEALELTGSARIDGDGNTLDNRLSGNISDNVLDGKSGADVMLGGRGNDIYVVDDAGDLVIETPGAGTDTVRSSITFTLPDFVEILTLLGTASINGVGNFDANTLEGNGGNNLLLGGDGNDILSGGAGNDRLFGDAGSDLLTGGTGADLFAFRDMTDFAGSNRVTDFSSAESDRIALNGIDANETVGGNDAFSFIGTAGFTAAGQVRYVSTFSGVTVQLNNDADLGVDATLFLDDVASLTTGDFVL